MLLTGRRGALRAEVHAALAAHGVRRLDVECFAEGAADTLAFKLASLRRLLAAHGGGGALRRVHIYEDRREHAARFAQLGESEAPHGCAWHVHHVGPEADADADAAQAAAAQQAAERPATRQARAREAAPQAAPQAAAPQAAPQAAPPRLPRFCCDGYVRLLVAPPAQAAAVPRAWRAAKARRDGADEAHITLLNRAETSAALAARRGAHIEASDAPAAAAAAAALGRAIAAVDPATQPLGIGVAVADGGAAAYLAVAWPGGAAFRAALGLAPSDFHCTLGFTGAGDPHGVPKGDATLLRRRGRGGGEGAWQGWGSRGALREAIQARAAKLLRADAAGGAPSSSGEDGGSSSGGGSGSGSSSSESESSSSESSRSRRRGRSSSRSRSGGSLSFRSASSESESESGRGRSRS